MNVPLAIAWRYFKRPTDRLVSAVGFASILGLVIGVMALVISMALMTGYRLDLEKKLLGGNAELFLYSVDGNIKGTAEVVRSVHDLPGVEGVSPVVFQHALVASERHGSGEPVMLKGVEASRAGRSPMLGKIVGARRSFRSPDGTAGIAVGTYLAEKLQLHEGDAVTVTVPTEHSGNFLPRSETFIVTSVYATGFYEFDARWMFLDLGQAETLFQTNGEANLIEFQLEPGADLTRVAAAVAARTGRRYTITDWRQMNRQLFSLLKIQQLVLFIVLGLIVFVSTFNIVSTLIMTVHEKRQEIGILLSMGGDRSLIRRIFVWYGTLVGMAGTLLGIGLGALVCFIITQFKLVSFGPEIAEVYFVSSIPFITRPGDLLVIAIFTVGVSFLATLLPSMRAARLNPIDALRHE